MDKNTKYRAIAKKAYVRAKAEIDSSDDNRLKYAVLELRMAIEALVYQRATNYDEELSNKKLNTWQPGKLIEILLEIDPFADQSSKLKFKPETKGNTVEKQWIDLGTESVLSLKDIKKNYHKLGSFLHTPTIKMLEAKKGLVSEKVRKSCLKVCDLLEKVFSSPIYNINFRNKVSTICTQCNEKIVRRIPFEEKKIVANCITCSASYDLEKINQKEIRWTPIQHKLKCMNPSCGSELFFWERDIVLGMKWECQDCNGENFIVPGIVYNSITK